MAVFFNLGALTWINVDFIIWAQVDEEAQTLEIIFASGKSMILSGTEAATLRQAIQMKSITVISPDKPLR